MTRQTWLCVALLAAGTLAPPARADDFRARQRDTINKGLEWIAKKQARDGHWEADGGKDPTNTTALAGMALLMGGSNLQEGKYADNVRKAVDWLVDCGQRNGRLGNHRSEAQDYMKGHGYAMLFLASIYGQTEKGVYRKDIGEALKRAVEFTGKAQTKRGGWGNVSADDGEDFDFNEVAVSQMQGLAACLNAGIDGPKPIMDKAMNYLEKCTTPRGGVVFSLAANHGRAELRGEQPNLTLRALVCSFSAGQYDSDLVKKWLKYCRTSISPDGRFQTDKYINYYYAQVMHTLGDRGYKRLFPDSQPEEAMTWSKYKEKFVDRMGVGNAWVLETSLNLAIFQVDGNKLPIYQRAKKDDIPRLIKDLGDKSAGIRRDAAEGIGLVGRIMASDAQDGVAPLCNTVLKDSDAKVRAAAAVSLGQTHLEPEKVVPILSKLVLEDKDSAVRLAAIAALGSFGAAAKGSLPILRQAEAQVVKELEKADRPNNEEALEVIADNLEIIRAALQRIEK